MIQKVSHMNVWVLDQTRALEFYVGKLGFEVRTDNRMGGFRWLTVSPKGQRDIEMILLPVGPGPMLDEATAATLRDLVKKGAIFGGILETDDCKATYDELRGRGVEFVGPPQERPYGIEALMKDDSGNWFSVVQRPR
jgi:predicted enzyme related to lactoylglutathione lyase